jgi:hypothetical protein
MVGRRCSSRSLMPSAAASNIQLLPAKELSAAAAAPADPFHTPAADFLLLFMLSDSVFFPEGLARAVQGLDPDMPYFICGMHCHCLLSRCAIERTASVQQASAPQLLAPSTHLAAAGRGAASHMLLGHCLSLRLMASMSVWPACACQVWVPTISQLGSELSARAQSCLAAFLTIKRR